MKKIILCFCYAIIYRTAYASRLQCLRIKVSKLPIEKKCAEQQATRSFDVVACNFFPGTKDFSAHYREVRDGLELTYHSTLYMTLDYYNSTEPTNDHEDILKKQFRERVKSCKYVVVNTATHLDINVKGKNFLTVLCGDK